MESNIRRENRRALPRFLGSLLLAGLIGGAAGFLIGCGSQYPLLTGLPERLHRFWGWAAPWGLGLSCLGFSLWGGLCCRSARRTFESWDGEDDAVINAAERSLSLALLSASLEMAAGFFLFAAAVVCGEESVTALPVSLLLFAGTLVSQVLIQQKAVDLERRINPEKQGSVYDRKFRRKWLESCDEAELRQIGQASFRAFQWTNRCCIALWACLVLGHLAFRTGLLPIFAVMLIWGVGQTAYILESLKTTR